MKAVSQVEFGDFQTPLPLAREVCALIHRLGENPDVVVEPTAGRGAFLTAAAEQFPKATLRGWEINPDYVTEAAAALQTANAPSGSSVVCQDFFTCNWEVVLAEQNGRILILGNPPLVTNAGVAAIDGTNVPVKENFMGLRGIAARTGLGTRMPQT